MSWGEYRRRPTAATGDNLWPTRTETPDPMRYGDDGDDDGWDGQDDQDVTYL